MLYFKSSSELVSAAKGTRNYNEIIEKIKQLSYLFGDEENEDDPDESNSLDEELLDQTPDKAALESEMDLVSDKSNSAL